MCKNPGKFRTSTASLDRLEFAGILQLFFDLKLGLLRSAGLRLVLWLELDKFLKFGVIWLNRVVHDHPEEVIFTLNLEGKRVQTFSDSWIDDIRHRVIAVRILLILEQISPSFIDAHL